MTIGFIGAGKVGFSMGKYMAERGMNVTGYYSRSAESSKEAAQFTQTHQYLHLEDLVRDSDALFLTVPDTMIAQVWEQLKILPIQNKLICHFSGALSSGIFSGIERVHAYGYSIHPLFAFHDRYESYKELSRAFFTIEGSQDQLDSVRKMINDLGNSCTVIRAEDKTAYHAAAAIASNLYVGLVYMSESILQRCGFTGEEAHAALSPLIANNTANILAAGPVQALTGPIERGDLQTVEQHMHCLSCQEGQVYRMVSGQVLQAARLKNPDRDYTKLEQYLQSLQAKI